MLGLGCNDDDDYALVDQMLLLAMKGSPHVVDADGLMEEHDEEEHVDDEDDVHDEIDEIDDDGVSEDGPVKTVLTL